MRPRRLAADDGEHSITIRLQFAEDAPAPENQIQIIIVLVDGKFSLLAA